MILLLLSLVLAFGVIGCSASETQTSNNTETNKQKVSEPLKVTLPTWTGYGPLFLAKEKGLFGKHGVNVELTIIEGLAERKQALAGGKLDGMATALDVQVTLAAAGIPVEVVWLLDDSYGGDGILVKNNIQSVQDLKGKTVAFEVGSTSHLLILTALKQAGLNDKDIEIVQMSAGDAGAAFTAGKVDAAVTWEPWLSKGSNADGKVLLSTVDLPGIIVDTVSFRKSVIEERPEDVQAFVNAMAEAMQYWEQNEEESNKIMAEGLKIDLAEFTGTVPGLKFFNKADNLKLFGSSTQKGSIYKSTQDAIDFYVEQKIIDAGIKAEEVLNDQFLAK